jgi:hypothetical protein
MASPTPRRRPLAEGLGFSSLAVHAGERLPAFDTKPVATPIYSTVAFEAPSAEDLDAVFDGRAAGYCYTRHGNPTLEALEETIVRLEQGAGAVAFASGMAAIHAALLGAGLRSGDYLVSSRDLYGATQALFRDALSPLGITTHYAPASNPDVFAAAVSNARPRVVFVETISNPLLRVADVAAIAIIARQAGAVTVVDSTFTSPFLVAPLALGADMVVHSTTKYLNGHGDATGGVVVCAREDTLAPLRQARTPHAAAVRECTSDRRVDRQPPRRKDGLLSQPALSSGPRGRVQAAPERAGRRGGVIRPPGSGQGRGVQVHGQPQTLWYRNNGGRHLQPGAVPRHLVAPSPERRRAKPPRHCRRPRPLVGRDRRSRRCHRRSRPGSRRGRTPKSRVTRSVWRV